LGEVNNNWFINFASLSETKDRLKEMVEDSGARFHLSIQKVLLEQLGGSVVMESNE
jgi:hypothetical protein